MDQDLLVRFHLCRIDKGLPGGQAYKGNGCRFLKSEVLRFYCNYRFINRHVFRISAIPCQISAAEYLIARLEARDLASDLPNDACHVEAGDVRELKFQSVSPPSLPD